MSDLILFAEAQYQAALLQLGAAKKLLESMKANTIAKKTETVTSFRWVYIDRLSEISGLSRNAIRNRVSKGIWREGIHYRHERPDSKKSRIIFNLREIEKCLSGEN